MGPRTKPFRRQADSHSDLLPPLTPEYMTHTLVGATGRSFRAAPYAHGGPIQHHNHRRMAGFPGFDAFTG